MKKFLDNFNSLESDKTFVVNQMSGRFDEGKEEEPPNEEKPKMENDDFDPKIFQPIDNSLSCFRMTHNGSGVYTGAYNGRVCFRRIGNPKRVVTHARLHTHVRAVALTNDERLLFTGGSDNNLRMVKADDVSQIMETFRTRSRVMCMCLFESKKFLFCGTYSGRIFAWKYNTGKDLPFFRTPKKQHERMVYCMCVIGDTHAGANKQDEPPLNTLVSCSEDKTLKQWNIATGEQLAQVSLEFPVYKVLLLRCGKVILQNFKDSEMWNIKRRNSLESMEKEHIFVNVTSFDVTPNQKILLGWNKLLGRFEFWDVENRILLFDIRLHDTVFLKQLTHVAKSRIIGKEGDGPTSEDFFMYHLTGRTLGRTEVRYADLLKKHESSNLYDVRQAYLSYEDLFKRSTETFTYNKVEAAQAIQDCVEKKLLKPGLPLDVQINRFFDYFNSKVKVEYEDDYKKKLRKISLEKVAFEKTLFDIGDIGESVYSVQELEAPLEDRVKFYHENNKKKLIDGKFTLIIQKTNILGDALSIFHSQFEQRKFCRDTMVCFTTASNKGFEKISTEGFFEILCDKILELLFVSFSSEQFEKKPYFNIAGGENEELLKTLKFLTLPELYQAAGRVLGYCVFHGIRIPFHMPPAVYKMLKGLPLVYEDLESVHPKMFLALDQILTSEDDTHDVGSVLKDLSLQISEEEGELSEIKLNSMEKYKYAQKAAINHLIEKNREKIESFVKGFHQICHPRELMLFEANELEILVCGFKKIDIDLWKRSCIFSRCSVSSEIIRWFFDVLQNELTFKEQAEFFHKVTDEFELTKTKPLEPIPLIIIVDLRDLANKIKGIKCNSVYNTIELPKYFSKFQLSENVKRLLTDQEME